MTFEDSTPGEGSSDAAGGLTDFEIESLVLNFWFGKVLSGSFFVSSTERAG